ncbi:type VI secretion system-associated protein TagF [Ideonella sp. BN130291]|uniref:type VI secretion system-associated protein TagF n=1 Tax=Ideonella sp. BN130291 TaxID=3112940 RepID=UPI002E25C8C9|nr:type VI secretion system-associated protein TagF [Ideonella sp. BN130291]
MSRSASPVTLAYFGKLPARGDFVRSVGQAPLTQTLDRWLTQGMELMAADTRWKLNYDQVPPAHFAFLGTQGRVALAGHLTASADASGRRFPFVMAGMFDVPAASQAFLACSPTALARLWTKLESLSRQACGSGAELGPVLAEVAGTTVEVEVEPQAYAANFADFLGIHTLGGLEAQLRQAGHTLSLRQTLLAIGLLLQPVVTQGVTQLERGLLLPAPQDPLYRPLVCSLWLALITPFLCRHDFELAVFLRAKPVQQLIVGFNGASARTLRALMDPGFAQEDLIAVSDAEWVEDMVDQSYGLRKLSSHLQQPELPLQTAFDSFIEAFLGQ